MLIICMYKLRQQSILWLRLCGISPPYFRPENYIDVRYYSQWGRGGGGGGIHFELTTSASTTTAAITTSTTNYNYKQIAGSHRQSYDGRTMVVLITLFMVSPTTGVFTFVQTPN